MENVSKLAPDGGKTFCICLCSVSFDYTVSPAEKVVSQTEKQKAASEGPRGPLALTSGVTCNPINASTAMLRE